jgi:HEAT repeat protein
LLVSMLDDPDRRVRNAAARSLGKQGAVEGVEPIVLALSAGAVSRAIGGQALIDIGAPAAESLVRLLDSRIREVRATAAELLGRVGNIEHAKILTGQLNHPDAEVRVAVVRALGRLGGRLAAQSVQSLLSDPVPYVRGAAATAVGRLGGAGAIDRLIEMATDDEFLPAHAAAMAAKELDPERVMAAAASGTSPHLVEASDLLGMASP